MEIFEEKNYSISYETYGESGRSTIIMLPPGVGRSSHYQKLGKLLSSNFYVIALDLPGVNRTSCNKCTVCQISKMIVDFLRAKKIRRPIIIGESYGANLAIMISKVISTKKLILIGGGDFFGTISKIILTIIFLPTKFSKLARKMYATILTRLKVVDLSDYKEYQLKCFQRRWEEVVWYRNPRFDSETYTLIINSKQDHFVNKNSIAKIKSNFTNHEHILLNCSHFGYMDCLLNSYKDILLDFING